MRDKTPTGVTLFVPCRSRPKDIGVDSEWIENDGSFAQAFSFGTVDSAGLAALAAAPGALVIYSPHDLGEGRAKVIALVERLSEGIAVRVEQSKLGWLRDQWLAMVGGYNPTELHRAVVVMLGGNKHVQSCGMHAFSLPDSRIDVDGDVDANAMRELLTTFNVYQIAEDPLLLSGQTFSPDQGAPKRVVQRWPDDGYPLSSPCNNPYGVWRLGPGGANGAPPTELNPTFIPTLVALLTATEAKNGKPLTKAQVEDVTNKGVCMAMKHRDVQKLERGRGYSDIDPRLVWEQWQIVRSKR